MKLAAPTGRLLAVAFHRDCACGRPVRSAWWGRRCGRCWIGSARPGRKTAPCAVCGLPQLGGGNCPDCAEMRFEFDKVHVAGPYEGVLKEAVREFKFHNRWSNRRVLLRTLIKALPQGGWDCVVAVPSAPAKERDGAPHLAAELAAKVAARLGLPLKGKLIKRRPKTRRQSELDGRERRAAARGSYSQGLGRLSGERVLLVDDVMTTGATASACAALLKSAGAKRVEVLVLARSPQRGD